MDEHGFASVTALETARDRLRDRCSTIDRTDEVSVTALDGRVLAAPVSPDRAVPHYDRAAMDGYAVRAADTHGAGERSPVRLSIADDRVTAGTAVPVHTGSALPDGADAVVMVERTERREAGLLVDTAVAVGENVGPAGEDVECGDRLFAAGHQCRPSDAALLRAVGHETVAVRERPRVSVIPTGEELVAPGVEPAPGEVVQTNGLLVGQLIERWGGRATTREIVTDDRAALRAALERDADRDLIVTTGGSSVGERDLIADVLETRGTLDTHGLAIKPGHPGGVGVIDGTVVIVLPGYPVSCLVNAVQLVRPALAWLAGAEPRPHPRRHGRLSAKLPSEPGRTTFARVRVSRNEEPTGAARFAEPDDGATAGGLAVEPVRTSGAGVLSSVTAADGWVVVPPSREGIPAGERVAVEEWERVEWAPSRD